MFILYTQHDSMQCGIACLAMVCKHYGKEFSIETLSRYCFASTEGVSLLGISEAANKLGLHSVCGRVSMYRWIWEDKRKKGTLYKYLRRKGKKYNKRRNSLAGRGYIPNRVDIEERPAIVDLKERFGDLEIDTVIGSNHKGALVTINDRLTSKVWIRKLSGKDAAPLALKTIEALQPIKDLIHTITADNGKEFAKHQEIAKELQISFYFYKPYHSWERGANENTNGFIRQYIPKGTDFSEIIDEFVSWIENKLNNRPRKRLGYLTPNEKFNLLLTN